MARLREAGIVLLGKTTTPEFGWKAVCDSPFTGITRKPMGPEHKTSGGSSGGAAVAAALGPGALAPRNGRRRLHPHSRRVLRCVRLQTDIWAGAAYPPSPFGTVAHLGPITALGRGCRADAHYPCTTGPRVIG